MGAAARESYRVLVVDDEPNIADVVSMALRYQGFEVETAGTGAEALAGVERFKPHLLVLDVMLPDMEGFDVAARLGAPRARLPIVFLTARDATQDKVRGLTMGGDDYVTKPFSLEELVARIRMILRRAGIAEPESSRLSFEDLELDEDTHEVSRGGESIELTATEYRLLRYLLLNPPSGCWPWPRSSTWSSARSCSTASTSRPAALGRALEDRDAAFGELPRGSGPGGPPGDVNLPPGTYGQLRSATGKVVDQVVLSYGQAAPSPPRIPSDLPVDRLLTVPSRRDDDLRYRVLAEPSFKSSGTTMVAVPLREVDQTLDRLLLVEALVIGGVLVALAAGAWFLVRRGLRPLERMEQAAGAIAAGDLSRRVSPANRKTEVGRLGLALNGMLGRLEQAFAERRASEQRLRRFLADASHELRTPLASIRGYAELFRTGAARDPANSEKAMRRIEDEAARMGVLVEDLLTLARLEEPRDRVREPVELAVLVGDAVDDARATAPERVIELATEPSAMVGDADQLRQVTGNLLRNALVHTPPASSIEVTLRHAGRELVLEVRDHGPGLGLAIVEAHGGRVEAANAPGDGAVFTVRLPDGAAPADARA